jgi:glycosyltransferase involved in cell wall biosynthesis
VEHFGMTTVEAMAAGCVPLVMNKGGQKEIINVNSGILWNSIGELSQTTIDLIHNPKRIKTYSKQAAIDAEKFNIARFNSQILSLMT